MAKEKRIRAEDGWNLLRGLCMGCADVVPGVSGGTVALILGIYVRLVTAISRVDGQLLSLCRQRRWLAAAEYLDLRFLVTLAAGIGTGIVGMSLIINQLLTGATSRSYTLAVFFGMILASAVLVGKLIKTDSPAEAGTVILVGIVAALLAFWISGLRHTGESDPALPWIFLCGAVGICAMILPGISGAMILLVLGVYVHLTEIPKNLLAGTLVQSSLLTLAVFASGCALGLLAFSKILRWLLTRFHSLTMAALCGFMFGALRNLWPFQRDLTPEVEKFKHKEFELLWPDLQAHTVTTLAFLVAAMIGVFLVDWFARRRG